MGILWCSNFFFALSLGVALEGLRQLLGQITSGKAIEFEPDLSSICFFGRPILQLLSVLFSIAPYTIDEGLLKV